MLVNIIKNSKDGEYSNQILKGVDKIEPTIYDNILLKKLLFNEIKNGEEINKNIFMMENELQSIKSNVREDSVKNAINEKHSLLDSIDSITAEIDYLNEQNTEYINILSNNTNIVDRLKAEINTYQKANKLLLKKIKADTTSITVDTKTR